MKIFRATLQHIEPIAFLFDQYRQFYKQDANLVACRAYLQRRFKNEDSVIFGAQNDGRQVIGFVQLHASFCSIEMRDIVIVDDLYVHTTARRQKAGTLLMSAAQAYAKEARVARLTLQSGFDNHAARGLFTQLGYTRDLDFFPYNLELSSS